MTIYTVFNFVGKLCIYQICASFLRVVYELVSLVVMMMMMFFFVSHHGLLRIDNVVYVYTLVTTIALPLWLNSSRTLPASSSSTALRSNFPPRSVRLGNCLTEDRLENIYSLLLYTDGDSVIRWLVAMGTASQSCVVGTTQCWHVIV